MSMVEGNLEYMIVILDEINSWPDTIPGCNLSYAVSITPSGRHYALVASLLTRRDCNRESRLWGSAKVHSHVDLCEGYIPTWRSHSPVTYDCSHKPALDKPALDSFKRYPWKYTA
ncbi:Sordarin/hypoxysordarin biosynthesis cluster protein P [Fusarium oxysporum f. sp. albedinis]|nr:Sordarin/hypoxysordarin biosynthesis cluster protein P [Fusarium oxysporum f. sp. albedinis]